MSASDESPAGSAASASAKVSERARASLAAILVYPLKGARGVALAESRVLRGGLAHDRRFMLVGPDGTFLSQRRSPRLALVRVQLRPDADAMTISVPGGRRRISVDVPLAPSGPRRTVRVWKDDVLATEVAGDAAQMLSDHLGERCALVHMPADVLRPVDPRYASPGDRVGFADAFPVLVASLASLADLAARMGRSITMDRFRPNLVLACARPYEEERHARVRIGAVVFRTPKRCARCEVTTIDQATAERGKEPLRTLASYRRDHHEVHFAMNAIPDVPDDAPERERTVRIGDAATFLDP
jgi:uncharacterized protein YcbX